MPDVSFPKVDPGDPNNSYEILSGEAKRALSRGSVDGVTAIDLGQGDCNALTTVWGHTVLYFDFGGGCHAGAHTHPTHETWGPRKLSPQQLAEKFDFSCKPTVIVSHWDHDHWYTSELVEDVRKLQWLGPRQPVAKNNLEAITKLDNLRCWPATLGEYELDLGSGRRLRIEKCKKPNSINQKKYDRNLDGLALFLKKMGWTKPTESIVMPGDAPWQCIPSLLANEGKIPGGAVGLFGYHHGSITHWTDETTKSMPKPAEKRTVKLLLTYGLTPAQKNSYNLAHPAAKARYHEAGWSPREDTAGKLPNDPPQPADVGNPATRGDRRLNLSPTVTMRLASMTRTSYTTLRNLLWKS